MTTDLPGGWLRRILHRDRLIVFAAVLPLLVASWGYTVTMAREAAAMDMTNMVGCSMNRIWNARDAAFGFVMWTAMMVAMMTPATVPMLLAVETLARGGLTRKPGREQPSIVLSFLAGYPLLWMAGLTAVVLAEKYLPAERAVSLLIGLSSLAGAVWLLVER